MTDRPKRAALYLRVSTDGQTTENQRLQLRQEAERRGWTITKQYEDQGISGAKKRDQRPGLTQLLYDARRGRFDVVMCAALDRLGRSLADLIGTLDELHGAHVDLYILNQGIDTTTPAGKMTFHIIGAVAEFERELMKTRIKAGIARARTQGKKLGRPPTDEAKIQEIVDMLQTGLGMGTTAKRLGVGVSLVQRIKKERLTTLTN